MAYNKPLGDRVLIREEGETERRSPGGLYLAQNNDQTRKGEVIETGNGISDITGNVIPMEVKVGDTVAYNKNVATSIRIDGEDFVLMREAELLIILDRKTQEDAISEAMSNTDPLSEEARISPEELEEAENG